MKYIICAKECMEGTSTDHCIKQVLEFFKNEEEFDFFNKKWFKN